MRSVSNIRRRDDNLCSGGSHAASCGSADSGSHSSCLGGDDGVGSSSRCSSSGRPILLLILLAATVIVTAAGVASATVVSNAVPAADESAQSQLEENLYSHYHELPRLKLYKACGLPLVLLLTRKCSRLGGVYMIETDPKFSHMVARQRELQNGTKPMVHMKVTKLAPSPRQLCFRRNYGVKNPFIDCCCSYCTERTVLSYCRLGGRPFSLRPRFQPRI